MRKKRRLLPIRFFPILIAAFFLAGCGYHIAGKSGVMPEGLTDLTIPIFTNATTKPDIEGIITGAFVSEFVTTVKVDEKSPARMTGVITSYNLKGVSFTSKDVTQEYRLSVGVSISVTDKNDGHVIWEDKGITDFEDFSVDTKDVTHTEEVEIEAFKKLSADMARKIKERMLERF